MLLLVHIAAGSLALLAGFAAVFAAKGEPLHRKAGLIFVVAMVVMGLSGSLVAVLHDQPGTVIAGLLATYLTVTAMTTVRPFDGVQRRLDVAMALVGFAVAAAVLTQGFLYSAAEARPDDAPRPVLFVFGTILSLAVLGDVRMLRAGLRGRQRLVRHVWRMCFALFIASGSFFLGQADEFPEPLRIFPLLAVPAFLPLLLMPYWIWRVRSGRWRATRAGRAVPQPVAGQVLAGKGGRR